MNNSYTEVPQRAFAIVKSTDRVQKIRTKNLLFCTAFTGINSSKSVAFLCHFDTPFSVFGTGDILSEIKSTSPNDNEFEAHIIHGTPLLFPYSLLVAGLLYIQLSRQSTLKFKIRYKGFSWAYLRRKISISLNSRSAWCKCLGYNIEMSVTSPKNNPWTMRYIRNENF